MTALGVLNPASCSRTPAISCPGSMVTPGSGTTTAVMASVHLSWGRPTTTASATRGSAAYTAFSTSIEATFSPPVLITSLYRSANQSTPSGPNQPTSPEWNQPCANAASVALALCRYSVMVLGPR